MYSVCVVCRAILSSDKQQDSAIYIWVYYSTLISPYYRHHPFYIHSYHHLSCCVVSNWASCQLRYTPFASFCASRVHFDKPFRAIPSRLSKWCRESITLSLEIDYSSLLRLCYWYHIGAFLCVWVCAGGLSVSPLYFDDGRCSKQKLWHLHRQVLLPKTNDVRATYEQVHERERSVTSLHQWPNCQFMIGNKIMSHFQDDVQ